MLKPIMDPDAKPTGDWKHLNKLNEVCPGCEKKICHTDGDIEYSKTKRNTHIFWHSSCTGRIWR